ncbi:hypothetical protein SDJN02_06797, partial [Cucurbita argyrosperma subsp. argyrosperma]
HSIGIWPLKHPSSSSKRRRPHYSIQCQKASISEFSPIIKQSPKFVASLSMWSDESGMLQRNEGGKISTHRNTFSISFC